MKEAKAPLQINPFDNRRASRLYLALAALLLWLAVGQYREQIILEGLIETSRNFRFALGAGYIGLASLFLLLALTFTAHWNRIANQVKKLQESGSALRSLAIIAGPLLIAAYLYLLLGFYGRFLLGSYTRLALFATFASLLALVAMLIGRKGFWLSLAFSALTLAAIHNAALFLQEVNSYPLSLGWSEISRYYQASFYFSQKVYGLDLALPITHPSRYLLQSIPFLLDNSPLWLHRLWQALLWIGMAGVTAWTFVRRLGFKKSWFALALGLYLYLFLMQGAVFYHLLPCVFIVLLTYDSKRFGRSLLFVFLASVWAGISRINWAPMPGALAVLLYVLEKPLDKDQPPLSLRYWGQPIAIFLAGLFTALGAYWLYIQNSGVPDIGQFGSSFTSDLLWQRLWPNDAFGYGILPGILLVSLPLFLILGITRRRQPMRAIRWLAVGLILLVFFGGGLVVSVKIGGGTNLHNMDAYIVLLLTLGLYFLFGRVAADDSQQGDFQMHWSHALLMLLVPVLMTVQLGGPLELPDRGVVEEAITLIQEQADFYLDQDMDVLFISQRHLITFHMVDVPLVHDYEKLFLMEMAISHNDPYLVRFQDDIENWRFGLIITDPLHKIIREDDEDSLAAENNEWVRFVARPILCYYSQVQGFPELGVDLMVPRFGDRCDE